MKSDIHAVVEKAVDAAGTVDWDSLPACLKGDSEFVGIDRNDLAESASEWIEFTITKRGCSVADAEAILLLALTSANESEGVIYLFDSSEAELMNLAMDVLSVIPLDAGGIANENQGEKPTGFAEWVQQLVSNLLEALWNLIVAIGEWIANLINAIIEAGMRLVEAIAPGAMAVIEAVVKTAILVFVYLFFGVSIIALTSLIVGLLILLVPIALIFRGDLEYGLSNVKATFLEFSIEMGYIIKSYYCVLLDLYVPLIKLYFNINDQELFSLEIGFFPPILNIEGQIDSEVVEHSSNPQISSEISSNNKLMNDNEESTIWDWQSFGSGLDFAMGALGSVVLLNDGMAITVGRKWDWGAILSVGLIIGAIATMIIGAVATGMKPEFLYAVILIALFTGFIELWSNAHPGHSFGVEAFFLGVGSKIMGIILTGLGLISAWVQLATYNAQDILAYLIAYWLGFGVAATIYTMAIVATFLLPRFCEDNWRIPHLIIAGGSFITAIIFVILLLFVSLG